jgi:amidohydrolase
MKTKSSAKKTAPTSASTAPGLSDLGQLLPELETVYRDIHSHPELSMQETRTASIAAKHLREAGFKVTTGVGKTGVVGLLKNGHGPTVMLRGDMDALPMKEETGLPYASEVIATNRAGEKVPVAHSCGHDMHTTWLIGAAKVLSSTAKTWQGTLMAVFQPGEETAEGAQAMIDDKIFQRFPKPDVVLGQHLVPAPAGILSGRAGVTMSAADSLQIRLFGRGGHGSMPQYTIDPVVMAAATVMRLQTIVSRELGTDEPAVVTVGVLQAGTKENVIPDEALIKLNIRTFNGKVRKHVLDAVKRIVNAEAEAAGATRKPEITALDRYAMVVNDSAASARVRDAFQQYFTKSRVIEGQPSSVSEDFGCFGSEGHMPSVFWFVGGTDPKIYEKARKAGRLEELPVSHNPRFAPVIHPTLQTGIETLVVAARAWLAP